MGLSPSSVSFGDVTVGQSSTKTVTLTSTGTGILTISGISVTGNGIHRFRPTSAYFFKCGPEHDHQRSVQANRECRG